MMNDYQRGQEAMREAATRMAERCGNQRAADLIATLPLPPDPAPREGMQDEARDAARWREIIADELAVKALCGNLGAEWLTTKVDENIMRRAALNKRDGG